ncbi:hypothetical protein DWF00_22745 [Bosea caraganae]|nr:hypothetical protein DWF00_22745 [Bosea caraganae]
MPSDPQIPNPARRTLTEMSPAERNRFQLQVAEYTESICADLRAMAQAAELDGLAYFIDMARLEASVQVESRQARAESG